MATGTRMMSGLALTDFARQHGVALTRFAYLLCGDRGLAEDLVQDAYLALYRRFGEWLPLEAPVAYARRAVANGNVSHARRRSTALTDVGPVPDRPQDPVDHDERDAMWQAMRDLSRRQRTVLVLRYYLDLPDSEIAAVLDCREATVRSLALRAFTHLRKHPGLTVERDAR